MVGTTGVSWDRIGMGLGEHVERTVARDNPSPKGLVEAKDILLPSLAQAEQDKLIYHRSLLLNNLFRKLYYSKYDHHRD
jgi:hypothetical protein